MLQRSAIKRIIPILKKDAKRTLRMQVPGFPKPYYVSFLLRDLEWFNTWASSGSMYRKRADHTRNVYADIRVGSYRYDQTTHGGLGDNDEERESVELVTLPIDDKVYDGLRLALWRLTETKFREALRDYSDKEADRISTVNPHSHLPCFSRARPIVSVKYGRPEHVDEEKWVDFVKSASKWISELPHVMTSSVEFDASHETKLFVSTEGATIVQHDQFYSLVAAMTKLARDGSTVKQEYVINCGTQREIPGTRMFRRIMLEKHQKLIRLSRAREIHSFSGPVLLYPKPSGLLFHEAIGHRLEGSRLLSTEEGQTFRGQVGKRILNVDLDVIDNPKLKHFRGSACIGAYEYDDEGMPAKKAVLIENGFLKDFLTTRAPIIEGNFVSNGHARSDKFQRPVSRMGVFIVRGRKTYSIQQLRELLIEEIKRQGKPFGLMVYETEGGETDTTSYDFQAFSGEISYATMVYPNGREELVRGVNLVGTPLQALNNIIAIGNELEVDNAYCGAESGMVAVTTISPAILLSNLELQAKQEERVPQYILPRPRL